MINKKADEPANPVRVPAKNAGTHVHTGLTKREYFAAMAMQGLLANPANSSFSFSKEFLIQYSVEASDLLLEKLEK